MRHATDMMALLVCAFALSLLLIFIRRIAVPPLLRTLTVAIDSWADDVQGEARQSR